MVLAEGLPVPPRGHSTSDAPSCTVHCMVTRCSSAGSDAAAGAALPKAPMAALAESPLLVVAGIGGDTAGLSGKSQRPGVHVVVVVVLAGGGGSGVEKNARRTGSHSASGGVICACGGGERGYCVGGGIYVCMRRLCHHLLHTHTYARIVCVVYDACTYMRSHAQVYRSSVHSEWLPAFA